MPYSLARSASRSRRRAWQSSDWPTRTWAERAGNPDVMVQIWRSCTSTTPSASAMLRPTCSASIPRGVASRRMLVESRKSDQEPEGGDHEHGPAQDLGGLAQARVCLHEDPDRDRHQRHPVKEGGQDLG